LWFCFFNIYFSYSIRIICVIALIACDSFLATYVPKQAKTLLNDTLSGTIVVLYGVVFYAVLKFVSSSMKYLNDLIFFPIINDIIRVFKFAACKHIARLPLLEVEKINPAVIVSRFWRMSLSMYRVFKTLLVQVIPTIVKFIVIFIALYNLHVLNDRILLISSCGLLSIIWTLFHYVRLKKQCWTVTDTANSVAQDYLSNMYWHKYYYQPFTDFLDGYFKKEATTWKTQNIWLNLVFLSFEFTVFLFSCCVLYATFIKIKSGVLSGGDFLLVEGYLIALLVPFRELFTEIRAIVDTRVDLEPIQKLFSSTIEVRQSVPTVYTDTLQIKELSFGYPTRSDVIKDFSLDLKKKDRLLISGPNGSGKTTLCHLILGLLPPSQGHILWNGMPVNTTPFDILSKDMMYVSGQHPFLDQMVETHLTFGRIAKKDDIQKALLQVCLPVSLDAKVKELSLGERQKILLARAFLLKPKILILDEALFMVDSESQEDILTKFDTFIDILIVVSHQQPTLTFTHKVDLNTW